MTDMFSKNPWKLDWADLQSSYMDSVNAFFQQKTSPSTAFDFGMAGASPWNQSMDYWWQANRSAMPADQFELLNKMMNQGRTLYFFGEQLSSLMQTVADQKQGAQAWQQQLEQQFEMMKQAYLEQSSKLYSDMGSEWNSAQDAWRAVLKNLPGLQNLSEENLTDADINEYIEKYLTMPGVGLNRELQEKIQNTLLSFKKYQETLADYQTAMNNVAVLAMDKLKDKLMAMGENKEKVESLRQIYDIWVDCNEDCYAEYVLSEDYSKLYGRLVNSMMLYKKDQAEIADEMNSINNLPSRNDFNEMIKEQHHLKHQLKRTQRSRDEERKRMDMLEQELQSLRKQVQGGAKASTSKAKSPANKTKTSRKKTTVKKNRSNSSSSKKNTVAKKTTKKKTAGKTADVIEIKF